MRIAALHTPIQTISPTQVSRPNALRFSGSGTSFRSVGIPNAFMPFLKFFSNCKDQTVYTDNIPADLAQQVEAAITKIQRNPQWESLLNDPAFRQKCHIYTEVADTLYECFIVQAVEQNILPHNPGTSLESAQKAFQRLLEVRGNEEGQTATQLLKWIILKQNQRLPWVEAKVTPLQYYSTRVGEELQELLEALALPKDQQRAWEKNLGLLLVDQTKVLADPKALAQYVVDGQLTPQFKQQLALARDLAMETARNTFNIDNPNAFLAYSLFKQSGRVPYNDDYKQKGIKSPKALMKPYEALWVASQIC